MKHFSFFPLSPHAFKYAGLLVALAGLLLFILLNSNYQLLLYAGLLVMIFSKERDESAYVALVRAEVFKSVFGYTLSLTIALNLTGWLADEFTAELSPFYYLGFPLLLYLFLFYGSLLLKVKLDSSVDFMEIMKRYPRMYIPWLVIVLGISVILLLRILTVI